ncbi:TolC family outer membrane protein [Pseudomonas viridiflava]|uniref:ABC transporter permease n=1 Tax=Pseudomonas viridiflava TaxID=33069 RepID=A0A3M5P8M5_PSEVI|nr:TolC family outer membrane protein [Pseudomonas viridiflava]MBA1231828.1 TolC family outer membrane protein [Pseudomonas viridiflava]RMT80941.1 ABC transporter permease [Pseudomonas viridiflava]
MIHFNSKAAVLAALLLCVAPTSHAMGPFQVYELALRNDPVFLGALKERDAGLENRTIGRAGLLPRVSYTYNKGRNDSKATLKGGREDTTDHRHYNSFGSALTVQQPLLDYEAYANYRKGVAQALFADETFRSKSQELLVRVLTAYTQALFAQDQINIAQAKQQAFNRQFEQNRQMFQQGEGTRTDILEAESRNELAIAEQIEARDEQDASLRELGALLGEPTLDIKQLEPLRDGFQTLALEPSSFTEWHALAMANSPVLASQRQALEVARYEVERNRAGHLPRVNAYASIRQNESDSGNTYNQRYDTNTVGIEVSLPLYAGGGTSASVRQANSLRDQAEYELEGKTRETLIELRRQFNACASGIGKLRAYQKALVSAQALVESTRQSILGGERINLDALNAEQQLYSTRRDLARARYDYLMAWIKLHYHAGTLRDTDLARIDEAFVVAR